MSNTNSNTKLQPFHAGEGAAFADMRLSPQVFKAIATIGYETPSPIQSQAIPLFLQGRDIIGVAQTGTGKTAAFALPILSLIDTKAKTPQVLCLVPTRELAIQVAEAFQSYAKHLSGFTVLPVYGGADYRGQIRQLQRGVQVVVGTPGRVMDHMRRGTLLLKDVNTLVLDEADEMLRMGFIDDIEWVLQQMPERYQSALFSATMPKPIRNIANKYLHNPAEITVELKATTAPSIRQRFLLLRNNEKLDNLTRILDVEAFEGMLIFVRTKHATLEIADRIQARGYAVEALNGDIAQSQREKTVARLKSGKIDIVVATDVAARGLDVDRISHVLNYDVPYDTESYVHRIGRTGRAGRKGDAILFVSGRERRMLEAIERTTRHAIEPFRFPSIEVLNERKTEQLFARIDTELQRDLSEYRSVINEFLRRSEIDPALLAAALASLESGGKPFYAKSPPRARSAALDRPEQSQRCDNREKRHSTRNEKLTTETYRLEVGEVHGVGKGDIVGAIANEAGIEPRYMGKIQLFEAHSLIELPEGMPKPIFRALKKIWVRGRQLQISKRGDQSGGSYQSPAAGTLGKVTANKRTRKNLKEKSRPQAH